MISAFADVLSSSAIVPPLLGNVSVAHDVPSAATRDVPADLDEYNEQLPNNGTLEDLINQVKKALTTRSSLPEAISNAAYINNNGDRSIKRLDQLFIANDHIGFQMMERVGIKLTVPDAIKSLKVA